MSATTEQKNTTDVGGFPYGDALQGLMKAFSASQIRIPNRINSGAAIRMGEDAPAFDERSAMLNIEQASDAGKGKNMAIGGGIGSAAGTGLGFLIGGPAGAQLGSQVGDLLGQGIGSLFGDGGAKRNLMNQMSAERSYSRQAQQRNDMQAQKQELDSYAEQNAARQKAKIKPYTMSNFIDF